MPYSNPIDIFLFSKLEEIDENSIGFINKLIYTKSKSANGEILKVIFNTSYDLKTTDNITETGMEGNVYKEYIADWDYIDEKTDAEILNMKKSYEQACLFLPYFYFKKLKLEMSKKIRKQIEVPAFYNRLIMSYDFDTEFFELAEKGSDIFNEKIGELINRYSEALRKDTFLKSIDDCEQKIKEIIMFHLMRARNIYIKMIKPTTSDKFMSNFIVSYYDFTHRNDERRDSIESNISLFLGQTDNYIKRQYDRLEKNRLKACFLDILAVLTNELNVDSIRVQEIIKNIRENFDLTVKLNQTKVGCVVLQNTFNIIIRHLNSLYRSEKLLFSRLIKMTNNKICDIMYGSMSAIKIYCIKLECPVCFDELHNTLVVECVQCKSFTCLTCALKINPSMCPNCRFLNQKILRLKYMDLYDFNDFQDDISLLAE
jgi:hypothetical protein